MKKYFIRKDYYSAMDWHDWSSYISFFGRPEDGFAVNKDDFLKLCFKDFDANHYDMKELGGSERVIKELNEHSVFESEFGIVDIGFALYDGDDDAYDEELTINSYENGFEIKLCYYLLSFEADEVVYLPVEQFLCLPKGSPGCQRCYSTYFKDFDAAYKFYDKLKTGDKISPYEEHMKSIFIGTKEDFDDDKWYKMNMEVLSLAPFPKSSETWHPKVEVQLEELKKNL